MYSYQSTPNFYSGVSNMPNYPSQWSYDQYQQIPNQKNFTHVAAPGMVNNINNCMNWSPENNYACNTSWPQFNPIQATPPLTPPTPEAPTAPWTAANVPRPCQKTTTMAKRHRAMITFIPTKTSNVKAIVKRKRKRTMFTTEQVQALEDIFKKKQYVTREEREGIAEQLELNDKSVKIWFQNRRLKNKKDAEQTEEEHDTEQNNSIGHMLDNVESKINANTDEFGYVRIDDGIINDLYNVIEDVLAQTPEDTAREVTSSPIYEPISPASDSSSKDNCSEASWEPSEPQESLQRLFDLQTMLAL